MDKLQFRCFSSVVPSLARPFVNIQSPRSTVSPPWATDDQNHYASILFGKPIAAHPVLVAQTVHKLPHLDIPQVAFVGKSNVGKSSLINALVHGKDIARTSMLPVSNAELLRLPKYAPVSSNPGRTRHLFTFDLSDHLSLVDLPGYGFAKVSKELREEWAVLVDEYLKRAFSLKRVVVLIGGEKGPEKLDIQLFDMLLEKQISFQVVLTKIDRLQPLELHTSVLRTLAAVQGYNHDLLWPFIHCVSSTKLLGIQELRCSLSAIASDYRNALGKRIVKTSRETPVRSHP